MQYPDIPFLILWILTIASGYLAAAMYFDLPWCLVAFVAINVATFALYGLDKLLAVFETRRVPERTLHLTAFLFGSPGALLAMIAFRHKTRKTSFQLVLAVLVLVQALIVMYFLWKEGFVVLS